MIPRPSLNQHLWGPEDGPLILALHGFLGSGSDWAPVAAHLPECRFLAPDLPGHGGSADADEALFDIPALAKHLADRQRPLAAVVGYSLGGRLAMHLAPHLSAETALLIISAHPGLPPQERAARLDQDHRLARSIEADFPAMLKQWLALPLFETLTARHRDRLTRQRLETGTPAALARALRGFSTGRQDDLRPELAACPSPIRLMAGERDSKYIEVLGRLPYPLHAVPDAGHNLLAEDPQAIAKVLRETLDT